MRTAPAPRGLRSRAACAALVICAAVCGAQLVNHPAGAGPNPFDGEGKLPGRFTVDDFPVETHMSAISLLGVDEFRFIASIYLYWHLAYDSEDAVAALRANYSSCSFFCASRVSIRLNSAGQPACCDNVLIPQALAINSRGYFTQNYADRWRITAESDTRIRYFRALQGRFEYSWHLGSFPFDSHYVVLDVLTAFKPTLARKGNMTVGGDFSLLDGYAQDGQGKSRAAKDPTQFRPDINSQSLPAWDVKSVHMEVIQLKRKYTKPTAAGVQEYVSRSGLLGQMHNGPGFPPLPPGQWRGGQYARYAVRLYIKIQRRSTGFWVMTCILPVALVTIFGFGVQSLPRQSLKARAELLSTIFLSLVLLQTVLHQFLPPIFFLALPLMLVLVGYVYTLLLFIVIIVANAMEDQWQRRQLKAQRRWGSQVFGWWVERLELGPGAQMALSLSAARSAAPFNVTHEQATHPLQGGRSKHRGRTGQTPDAASVASQQSAWFARHCGRWWFRIPPIRLFLEWQEFSGLEGSQDYCRLVAKRFDQGARLVLLVTYICVVVALCLTVSARSDSQANAPIFPQ